jgi:hypothetical protein
MLAIRVRYLSLRGPRILSGGCPAALDKNGLTLFISKPEGNLLYQ